jgi:hypothetical protein
VRLKAKQESGPVTLSMRLGEVGIALVFLTLLGACLIFSGPDVIPVEEKTSQS